MSKINNDTLIIAHQFKSDFIPKLDAGILRDQFIDYINANFDYLNNKENQLQYPNMESMLQDSLYSDWENSTDFKYTELLGYTNIYLGDQFIDYVKILDLHNIIHNHIMTTLTIAYYTAGDLKDVTINKHFTDRVQKTFNMPYHEFIELQEVKDIYTDYGHLMIRP